MIYPPSGLSGVTGSPITIRALNDGRAVIDGEFQRHPVYLDGNSWWVFEGFNAKSATGCVINVYNHSNNNIFRRIVAWDAHIAKNTHVMLVNNSSNTLFEDVAAFGTGHTMFANFDSGATGTVLRRVWGRFEGTITQAFAETFQLGYDIYPGYLAENVIATYTAESQPEIYSRTDPYGNIIGPTYTNYQMNGPSALMSSQNRPGVAAGMRIYGSLAYIGATPGQSQPYYMLRIPNDTTARIKNTLTVVAPSANQGIVGFRLDDVPSGATSQADRITSIRANGSGFANASGDYFGANWSIVSPSIGTSVGEVTNPWTTTGAGANLCYRWINGVQTTTPLWPWPMNDRIKAATASAGAYNGPCPSCAGVAPRVRTATDVTAQVEGLLGPIPAQCKNN